MPRCASTFRHGLAETYGPGNDPNVNLRDDGSKSAEGSSSARIDSLRSSGSSKERYTFEGEIARGGMGAVLGVYDQDLRRKLAMKVILPTGVGSVSDGTLARFMEEAQVTAQLDHPGVVPVHEMGLDGQGQVYFTMKLVKGQDLKAVFDKVHAGDKEWTTSRILNVILRVCEALAFAHSKGVIHRDLKPANIMVGRFGEVYVMDWGIARVLGRPDRKDLRLQPDPGQTEVIRSDRRETPARDDGIDPPLLTMDGDVVGTPAFMPIEQAEGRLQDVGYESDIYSLGAILYELLAGQMPYVPPGARLSARAVHYAVLQGPPTPLEELAPTSPPELLAICNKAMARRKEDRYPATEEFAADLRAFLEQRVVKAYRTGIVVELRKWMQRNKGLAAAVAAGLVLLLGLGGTAVVAAATKEKNEQLALAVEERDEANAALDDRNRLLGDLEILRDLQQSEQELWPARPHLLDAMDEWLAEAGELLIGVPEHELDLASLRTEAASVSDEGVAEALARSDRRREYEDAGVILSQPEAEIAALTEGEGEEPTDAQGRITLIAERDSLLALRAEIEDAARTTVQWRFPDDPGKQWRHDNLAVLVEGARALESADTGLIASMEIRRDRANTITEITVDEHFKAWLDAIDAIAASDHYDGLELSEQVGLIPLGPDPDSGLWEFWHVESGTRPEWSEEEGVTPTEDMGLVLVLIPDGTCWMGASADPASPHHDPEAQSDEGQSDEGPVHEVTLAPYLISKYELTQGQWFRMTGERPSQYGAGLSIGGNDQLDTNPVTNVSWEDGQRVLPRYGLRLPTEAQWECACRAGSPSPWWCGDRSDIVGPEGIAGNVFDEGSLARGASAAVGASEPWDDGHSVPAPAGTYRANGFGLHDVLGNVWEWCEDEYVQSAYQFPVNAEDGHRLLLGNRAVGPGSRVVRGGSFLYVAVFARSANRNWFSPSVRNRNLGLRPAHGITTD
ncbi:MAG: serine/threonine protein kinase/formylglycine-generating enzyme required for sulfatase activity [Planctomycetota bacterium]|jgi:serine/threonine protein kinase/formylglycine-generating enzyme required for sulfatase activity